MFGGSRPAREIGGQSHHLRPQTRTPAQGISLAARRSTALDGARRRSSFAVLQLRPKDQRRLPGLRLKINLTSDPGIVIVHKKQNVSKAGDGVPILRPRVGRGRHDVGVNFAFLFNRPTRADI